MSNEELSRQLPYAACILTLFVFFGVLVRRGKIKGRAILGYGILVGVLAVSASLLESLPLWQASADDPTRIALLLVNPIAMVLVSVFCVSFTYQTQRVEDLATHTLGDTKVIVRSCLPNCIPDADALLLPTATDMRFVGGLAGPIGFVAGGAVERAATSRTPAGIGKVVETEGGKLAVGHIYHVAVYEPLRSVTAATLKRGIETASLQARKRGAESLAVPLGPLPGLSAADSMKATVEGVLKHRKAFGEIVFVAFDRRAARLADEIVRSAVNELTPAPQNQISNSENRKRVEGK